MKLFPAIDLYEGKAVRLLQGDYRRMTVYSDSPAELAAELEKKGAEWLHLVDLEGAREGHPVNFSVAEEICKNTGLRVELGGGVRSMESIEACLSAGVERVILGTRAVTDEAFLKEALRRYGSRVSVGVDARDGQVAVKGWRELLPLDMFSFLQRLRELGTAHVIVTDISRDGAMQGVNLPLYERLSELSGMKVTASGGVSSYEDLLKLRQTGIYGAILGKAMYEGAVEAGEALRLLREEKG